MVKELLDLTVSLPRAGLLEYAAVPIFFLTIEAIENSNSSLHACRARGVTD